MSGAHSLLRAYVAAALCVATAACSGSPTGPSGSRVPTSTFLSFISAPGDFIGEGETHRYTLSDGVWTARVLRNYGVQGSEAVEVRVNAPPPVTQGYWWWTLDLAAPAGKPITVGTYETARRWPFQGATLPGLNFSGTGRGCNELTGRFEILDLVISAAGDTVDRLHATFEQRCEGRSAALTGEVAVVANPWR